MSKMKKQVKGIICLSAVLAVLGGGFAFLKLTEPAEEESSESSQLSYPDSKEGAGITIVTDSEEEGAPLGTVKSAVIKNAEGEIKVKLLEKANEDEGTSNTYTLEGFDDVNVNTSMVGTLVNNGNGMESSALIAENCTDLAKFGLDKPEVTMTKDIKEKHRYSQHYLDVIDLKNISLHDIPIDEGLDVIPRYSKNVMVEHDREAERMFRDRGQPREIVFVNCEGIVKNHEFIDVMKRILNTLEIAYDYPVDIEYTVNVGENKSFNINLLQCRPLQVSVNNEAIEMPENQNVFFHIKESSMGMSRKSEIDIICYVDPHKYYEYPYAQKSSLSRIISDVNAYCKNNDKTALLIVPGRIGTSSPELGIPVVFADISHFTAILEEAYSDVGYMPELSFGSHMFQDLVEAEIYYGALFENEKRIEFNRDMIFDYPNILNDINPNLNDEIYDMIQVIDFDKDKAELYHDMNKDETMCIFK